MSLDIGRHGWIGVGLQSASQVPATIADYVDFTSNTLMGEQNQLEIDAATGLRDKILSTVPGTNSSNGDIEVYADSIKTGYFVVAALGTVQTVSLGSGVYRHTVTRNNSNDPQFLTITSDRVKDRQLYPDVAVGQFNLSVGTDLVKAKATLVGAFPQTTTSGTKTTTSGNVFSFANAQFAFATTISGAQSATPLKPHDFSLNINNNTTAQFGQSQLGPRSINHGDFEVSADFNLYFENTTDRDAYYNQTKQAASFELYGNGIGGGFTESLVFNFYQVSTKTFSVETGIDNFFAEKVSLLGEFNTAAQRTMDAVITNTKSLYI